MRMARTQGSSTSATSWRLRRTTTSAHFLVHDTEQNRYALLGDVIAGYREINDADIDERDLVSIGTLLAVARHTWVLARFGAAAVDHPYMRWMTGRIRTLLARA